MHILDATLIALGVVVGPSVLVWGLLWLFDHVQSPVARLAVGTAVLSTFASIYALPTGLLSRLF